MKSVPMLSIFFNRLNERIQIKNIFVLLTDMQQKIFTINFFLVFLVFIESYDLCIRNIGFLEKVRLKFWKHYKVLKRYCHINSKKENKDFIWEEYAKISSTWFFNKLKENAKATDEELKVLWETYYK